MGRANRLLVCLGPLAAFVSCVDLTLPAELDTRDAGRDAAIQDGPIDRPVDMTVVQDGPDTAEPPPDATGDAADATDAEDAQMDAADATPDTGEAGPDLIETGLPCAAGTQCASAFCVDGVCCGTACTGLCQACNMPGTVGTCTPVAAGEDPREDCQQGPASGCGLDGTCDGRGACRSYIPGTECAPGSCAGAIETAASTCDGNGTCQPGGTRSCDPNVCSGASCASSCSGDAQCQTGFYCAGSTCAVKKTVGATCAAANQCATGFCVDGFCCASQCAQPCFACSIAGSVGTCTAVPTGQDPRNQCPAEAPSTCGRAGGCNGMGACRLHSSSAVCGAPSCTGSTATAASLCNGLGTCTPGAVSSCQPYTCGAGTNACATTCSTNAQCQPGFSCSGNACVATPGLVLFWRFEEDGAIADDTSASGFDGTYVGGFGLPAVSALVPPAITYPNTKSRFFTASNTQAVRLPNMPPAVRPSVTLTVSAWYRTTATDSHGGEIVSGGNAYILRVRSADDGRMEFTRRSGGSFLQCFATVGTYLDGNWHHIAGVNDATGLRLYFDGVERCFLPDTTPINYGGAGPDFWVGRHGSGQTIYDFQGNIDEVRVYNRALSATEIAQLAQGSN